MAFKDIHKLKKIVEIQKENIDIPHLVIGKDVFAISIYRHLVNKFGENQVRLLSEDRITFSDLYFKGPSTIRSVDNINYMKSHFNLDSIVEISQLPLFYKDLTWKSFGGRSKSETLKFDEDFYVSKRLDINEKMLFDWLENSDHFLNSLNEKAYQVKIKNLNFEAGIFFIECVNGTEFKAENLYFGKSPAYFLKKYSEKNHLSDKFIQFCESTVSPSALFIKYVFDKPISDLNETLFIPLSYTHEWGHFVGEFKLVEGKQSAEFIHFIN